MELKNLLYEKKNKIALVTINRPDKLNALNQLTFTEMEFIFNEINNDDEIHVVIITGAGEKAFIAGADISELNKLDIISGKEFAEKGQAIFNLIENLNKPVIAAVNGFALGGGSELAWACHIRLASENAKFGQPEVNLGIIPGYGGTQRLTRLINSGRALEYILTADRIDAHEAFRLGLVNHVYPAAELIPKAFELAEKISSKPFQAIKLSVKAVRAVDNMGLREGQNYEASLFAIACGTEDFKEGTSAFLEKRQPNFKNC
ncbi:MAG: enoyl-CoA hydratase [Chlorobiaceae bacterium]|nr:enoyl-CoA hydratase [Chlorobiaceae bacterium]MBA4309990.1 enoyl-CoA hydratase [Chlorobiaceae bacterium]